MKYRILSLSAAFHAIAQYSPLGLCAFVWCHQPISTVSMIILYVNKNLCVLLKTESLTTHRMLAEGHLSTKVLLIFRISQCLGIQ